MYDVYFHLSDRDFEAHISAAQLFVLHPMRRPDAYAHTLRDAVDAALYEAVPTTVLEGDVLVATWSPDEGARYYAGRAP